MPENEEERAMESDGVMTIAARAQAHQPTAGFGVLDRDLNFLEVDPTLAALHGVAAEQHLGRPLGVVLPSMAASIEPLARHVLATGAPLSDIELYGILPSGEVCAWVASYYPLLTRAGSVLGVECVVRPLGADCAAPAPGSPHAGPSGTQGESPCLDTAALQALLAAAPCGVALLDRGLRVVRANERLAALLGRAAAEPRGRSARELLPEHAAVCEASCLQVLATGEAVVDQPLSLAAQSSLRYGLLSYYPLPGAGPTAEGVLLMLSDVTEQRLAEAALRRLYREAEVSARIVAEERAQSEALIAEAPVGLAVLDRELRVVRLNACLAEAAGLSAAEYRLYTGERGAERHLARLVAAAGLPVAGGPGLPIGVVMPALAPVVEPLLAQVLAEGRPALDHELCLDGLRGERLCRLSLFPLATAEGGLVGLVLTEIAELRGLAPVARDRLFAHGATLE